ncbi:hypothetical protein VZT92_012198 [Zoarces viviparus]|uniref:Immunoglobulin V-set domain-containing protein n=1 Tax=Zoarces viviparus TaxID=48416 RepID=A0AAW1F893_ZOAVI
MKAHWWSCVLGLLCMPSGVTLSASKVSQDPTSISLTRVNSSAEITCSTLQSDPMSLSLHRRFPEKKQIAFLALKNGLVSKTTPSVGFHGRIHAAPSKRIGDGHGFTVQLSLLGLEDTNLYYCSWAFFKKETSSDETLYSPGTVIIVRERDPQEQCRGHILDHILIGLSVAAFCVVLFLCVAALIVRRKRFRRQFRPARAAEPTRPNRPQHRCPHHGVQHDPYLVTSVNSSSNRGI